MPRANKYLLLYVLDLLSVFASKADKNLMNATSACQRSSAKRVSETHSTDLAAIFRPGLISDPNRDISAQEHQLSQQVIEFLIWQSDLFSLADANNLSVATSSDKENPQAVVVEEAQEVPLGKSVDQGRLCCPTFKSIYSSYRSIQIHLLSLLRMHRRTALPLPLPLCHHRSHY